MTVNQLKNGLERKINYLGENKMGDLMQLHFTIQGILDIVGIGVLIILVIVLVIWHFIY